MATLTRSLLTEQYDWGNNSMMTKCHQLNPYSIPSWCLYKSLGSNNHYIELQDWVSYHSSSSYSSHSYSSSSSSSSSSSTSSSSSGFTPKQLVAMWTRIHLYLQHILPSYHQPAHWFSCDTRPQWQISRYFNASHASLTSNVVYCLFYGIMKFSPLVCKCYHSGSLWWI